MKTLLGPGIFLAQFIDNRAPFDTLPHLAQWAAAKGFRGIQIPTSNPNIFDLVLAAESQTYCDDIKGLLAGNGLVVTELSTHLQGQLIVSAQLTTRLALQECHVQWANPSGLAHR